MLKKNLPFLVASALVLAVLISLGNWQVRRHYEKAEFIAAANAQLAAAPVPLPAAPSPEADRFRAVAVEGRYAPDEIRVLVSTRDYGAGYRIIQAFETTLGRRLLVDRGYVRNADKDAPRKGGKGALAGNLHWPDERDGYTPEDDLSGNIWYARDVAKMAAALGAEEVLLILREQTPPSAEILPLPLDTSTIPNRHLEYIITWYGLALVWVLMTAYFLIRRARSAET